MTNAKPELELKLVISIGSNIPSKLGGPIGTIAAIRPQIEKSINDWNFALTSPTSKDEIFDRSLSFKWSSLFETNPLGGPTGQPNFINTVLVVDGESFNMANPNQKAAIDLMKKFLDLEKIAGRERKSTSISWGPRSLDIDFISWGGLQVNTEILILPHPRFSERNFVLIPLTEVLAKTQGNPIRIKPQDSWPE